MMLLLLQRKEQQAALNGAPSAEFAATETGLSSQKRGKKTKTNPKKNNKQKKPKPILWIHYSKDIFEPLTVSQKWLHQQKHSHLNTQTHVYRQTVVPVWKYKNTDTCSHQQISRQGT